MITRDRAALQAGLSGKLLQGCLNEHLRRTPELRRLRDAYQLRAPILQRWRAEGLPNHHLAHGYARYIVNIAAAYLVGAAVTYQGEGDGADALRRAYKNANVSGVDMELARQAALYGRGVEVIYSDAQAQPRSAALDPLSAFVVYADDVSADPLFGVHFHPITNESGTPCGYEAEPRSLPFPEGQTAPAPACRAQCSAFQGPDR